MTAAGQVAVPAPEVGGFQRRGLLLVGVAIVLTGLNLRTAVNSVGPVLQELQTGLGISSGLAGLVTTMPVLCFAALGFAGPPLAARFRDGHVLGGALLAMAAGMVLRVAGGSFGWFLAGTLLSMTGGALGNVLLPSLVKRHFPTRTGLLVGAYGTAMAIGATVASAATAPIAAQFGADGWRWALGLWAVFALLAALPWLAVPARPVGAPGTRVPVRMRALLRSPLAIVLAAFFGLQGMQAYVIVGWSAQYLRDAGLGASDAGLLLGLSVLVAIPLNAVVPALTVRPHLQRPLLVGFVACYLAGWSGLALAPLTATWLWMVLLGGGTGTFSMLLTLIGLRARSAETTAALSTVTQGWGYLLAAVGPLLVGVFRGATSGYTGMFVVVFAGVLGILLTGWVATRQRYVEDDIPSWSAAAAHSSEPPVTPGVEPAGHVTEPGGGSPRG